ncbi:nucleotidyltransferase family protein [Vandammella animalimorsus]|uniref:nucleotidyltransferase family protein n=1 Tax=Vandammella animalimorsus TaxID=2029117 RepID=UPI0031BB5B11
MHFSPPALAQAMILAAGRGQRMRPLTDHTPKPLLMVRGQPLLAWHLAAMARAGIDCALINTGWLGEQIPARLGKRFAPIEASTPASAECLGSPAPTPAAVQLLYSREDLDFGGGIETAGGIARALPQLQHVFWLVAGDVYAPQFRFDPQARARFASSDALAHLWLVPNPPHHPRGDFLLEHGLARPLPEHASDAQHGQSYTYSTIALLKQALFAPPWCELPRGNPQGQAAALGPLLQRAARAGRVSASLYQGDWTDVGTPQRLAALNQPPA